MNKPSWGYPPIVLVEGDGNNKLKHREFSKPIPTDKTISVSAILASKRNTPFLEIDEDNEFKELDNHIHQKPFTGGSSRRDMHEESVSSTLSSFDDLK
jgi:hypothetical protein